MTVPPLRSAPRLAWALLVLLPACRSAETGREDEVLRAVQDGRYAQALERARMLAEAAPDDARAQRLARDAELAFLLDRGRDAVFHGELDEALALFRRAEALAPEHPVVVAWIGKTRAQLAVHWLDRAAELTGPEHLHDQELAYEKVLEYDPDNPAAIDGLSRALLLQNYRAGMSKTYFDDGLAGFRELLLEQARRSFQVSRRYRENEPAERRGEQVEELMAEERLAQAKELEAKGLYFAARNEYRLVLLIDPEDAEARAGLDRMDREVRATRTLAEADMAMRRGQLTDAEQKLDHALVLTDAQKDGVTLMKSDIEDRRLEELYQEARLLADDHRFPEAVATFETLIAQAPEYKDARARKETYEEFIALTEEFYAQALAAPDEESAERLLRAIPVIWPEYKDVEERIAAIEARKAAAAPAGSAADPAAAAQRDDG